MKKQNENGRISEDRLSRANKRKKNNTIASILVMTGCLLVLVLVTYVAGILYSWIDSKFQSNANALAAAAEAGRQTEESTQEVVKTYTQEEVDALIAEAKQQAEDEEENKILSKVHLLLQKICLSGTQLGNFGYNILVFFRLQIF